jgi:hypothetical protein
MGENAMDGRLSWDEVKKLYPNEWVCLVDVEPPDLGEITSCVVYAHDPKHNALLEKQKHLKSAAILWTGKIRGRIHVIEDDVDGRV